MKSNNPAFYKVILHILIFFSFVFIKLFNTSFFLKKTELFALETHENQQDLVSILTKMQKQLDIIEQNTKKQGEEIEKIKITQKKNNQLTNKKEINEKTKNISSVDKKKNTQSNQEEILNSNKNLEIPKKQSKQNSSENEIDISKSPQYLESRSSSSDSPQSIDQFKNKISKQDKADGFEEYQQAYDMLRYANSTNKDFSLSFDAMEKFVNKYPNHPMAGNAYYWIGEIYFYNKQYEKAAVQYLKGYSSPRGERSIFNLLGLARSYLKIGKKEDVCSTIMHMQKEYPNADNVIKKEARDLINEAGC
ncbi:tol-pal system YbgF family protein [Lyticum sinuosum]|uniref:Tol-pal system protein YbgF n=1 Tax=Lyticum sinuosum TaxID=1332059 RepID=A0AAE4VM32_9RICK|nr:hypothetical protein [Lyticum sinuosum]MDZ5761396.1 Tol-pal system protein YbgF [Lyticum sinuosum]